MGKVVRIIRFKAHDYENCLCYGYSIARYAKSKKE